MIDTPYTKAIIPAVSVALLIGLGIIGNPMLGSVADAVGPGESDAAPEGATPTTPAGSGGSSDAASSRAQGTETAGIDESVDAEENDRRTPADAGRAMVDVYSDGDTDGSRVGTGDPDMSLLSPDSVMGLALREPFYLLDGADSSLDRTLRSIDETTTDVGDAVADGEVPADEVADGADETSDAVGDSVNDTTDTVDGTSDTGGEVVDDTTDDATDVVDNTTDGETSDTTGTVDDATGSATGAVETAVDDTTDAVDDTTDTVDDTSDTLLGDDESTPTPTDDGGDIL